MAANSGQPPRSRRRLTTAAVTLLVAAALGAGMVFGVRTLWDRLTSVTRSAVCTVGTFEIDNSQASVAAQMTAVVVRRGLPERAAVLALAAALQESKLRNLSGGDRDSVGVLQQRPSQGWGTAEQISDVSYATGKFLDALVKVDGWETGDLATTIQAVQISADGSAYAQHEAQAQALADALTGVTPAGISCFYRNVVTQVSAAELGNKLSAALPVSAPSVSGKTVTVPGAGWTTAAWLVAQSAQYGVTSVAYAGKRWTLDDGWRNDAKASSSAVVGTVS